MNRSLIRTGILLFAILILEMSCNVPRIMWPKEDVQVSEVNSPELKTRLLIASRTSPFKEMVVKRLKEYYADKDVYVKVIGVDQLRKENMRDYTCVLIMSSCIAWGVEPQVQTCIEGNPYYYGFVVFATSGKGTWKPGLRHEELDTISGASIMASVDEKSQELATRIDRRMKEQARFR